MRILAVTVTYNPDTALLGKALQSAAPQVQGLAVVDNGSANAEEIRTLVSAVGAQFLANQQNSASPPPRTKASTWRERPASRTFCCSTKTRF